MKNNKTTILSLVVIFIIFSIGIFSDKSNVVDASGSISEISGYAWSDNIGWIDFKPLYGGVTIDDDTGLFSGYAWSDNIGWIDFAPASGYPEAPSQGVKLESDGSLTGWARALSFGGGWDGWIKFNGTNYGVTNNGGVLDGYAWGSDVIGWLWFDSSGTITNPARIVSTTVIVTLTSNPTDISSGGSSVLTWVSTNATSCSADWDGNISATSGTDSISPVATTLYTMTCIGAFGDGEGSSTVTVIAAINAVNDTANVNENSFVNINNLTNDSGDSIFVESLTNPSCGSVVNNSSSVRYINTSYCSGSDSFNYTIEDSLGNQSTATININIYDCGDGVSQGDEQCDLGASNGTCPSACSSVCTTNIGCTVCGNGVCEDPTETSLNCPVDCPVPSVCGNGACELDESFFTCQVDCPSTFIEF